MAQSAQARSHELRQKLKRANESFIKTVSVLRAAVSHLESGEWKKEDKKAS